MESDSHPVISAQGRGPRGLTYIRQRSESLLTSYNSGLLLEHLIWIQKRPFVFPQNKRFGGDARPKISTIAGLA